MPPMMLCMFGSKGTDRLEHCSGITGARLAQMSLAALYKPVQHW